MGFTVYEMTYTRSDLIPCDIECVPFDKRYFSQYMKIYNECFYDMRKALDVKPYDFLSTHDQIADKTDDVFLFLNGDEIIGSVACYGNETDDLIVNRKYQRKGYGKKLLFWAINHIRHKNSDPVTLHVAEWNQNAVRMYENAGFTVTRTEHIQ